MTVERRPAKTEDEVRISQMQAVSRGTLLSVDRCTIVGLENYIKFRLSGTPRSETWLMVYDVLEFEGWHRRLNQSVLAICQICSDDFQQTVGRLIPPPVLRRLARLAGLSWPDAKQESVRDLIEFAAENSTTGNLSRKDVGSRKRGRSVEEVRVEAEQHLQRNPWPGLNSFSRLLSCSPATLKKAAERSQDLLTAKLTHENQKRSVSVSRSLDGRDVPDKGQTGFGLDLRAEDEDGLLLRLMKFATEEEKKKLLERPRIELMEIAAIAFSDPDA